MKELLESCQRGIISIFPYTKTLQETSTDLENSWKSPGIFPWPKDSVLENCPIYLCVYFICELLCRVFVFVLVLV